MGNLDSKLSSPYYAIVDENLNDSNLKPDEQQAPNHFSTAQLFWTIKKANFNNENKNALLFEFNHGKFSNELKKKYLPLALNQIKMLKTIRHPNIVKYFYSEENSPANVNVNHVKCLLITESIRPLSNLINELNKEEIIRGLFSITTAISFLHDKASISHNNICEASVYLNGKRTWKLSNFELAISFTDLNRANLKQIYDLKNKNAITPEEEDDSSSKSKLDLDSILKKHPHTIDCYGWAMLTLNLLPKNTEITTSNNAFKDKHKETSLSSISISSTIEYTKFNNQDKNLSSELSEMDVINNNEDGVENKEYDLNSSLEYLELFLNKDPTKRPTLKNALSMSLFDSYRNPTVSSANSSSSLQNLSEYQLFKNKNKSGLEEANDKSNVLYELYKLDNLSDLEKNVSKLVDYLKVLIKNNDSYDGQTNKKKKLENDGLKAIKTNSNQVNEKLIDFLLSPLMFFSSDIRDKIFPCVFIPKEELNLIKNCTKMDKTKFNLNHFYFSYVNKKLNQNKGKTGMDVDDGEKQGLDPFIDLDKYKAFVLPRVLNLFSMHSTQIRLVLLEYFPFYVMYINDVDTLRYEILPELLLGLKDSNDQLVSLTFSCLSIMVHLLGSEIVVGKNQNSKKRNKYFSDNLPKTIIHMNSKEDISSQNSTSLQKKNEVSGISANSTLSKKSDLEEDLMNIISKNDYVDGDSSIKSKNKIFSDSMIALHDENESNYVGSASSSNKISFNDFRNNIFNSQHDENFDDKDNVDDGEWSNDFGWGQSDFVNGNNLQSNSLSVNIIENSKYHESTASLVSLAGSEISPTNKEKSFQLNGSNGLGTNAQNSYSNSSNEFVRIKKPLNLASSSDQIGSEYDIKSINIKKISTTKPPEDDLIENFLNEMQPVIKTSNLSTKLNEMANIDAKTKTNETSTKSSININARNLNSWDCEEEIELDEI